MYIHIHRSLYDDTVTVLSQHWSQHWHMLVNCVLFVILGVSCVYVSKHNVYIIDMNITSALHALSAGDFNEDSESEKFGLHPSLLKTVVDAHDRRLGVSFQALLH